MIRRVLVIATVVLAWRAEADPRPPDARDPGHDRVAYIAGLLEAVRTSDPTMIVDASKYIAAVERNKCRAPEQSLRVGCLLEAAAQNCRQADAAARERCHRVSDLIVTNRLSESIFIPKDVRYQLMNEHRDYKAALTRELHAQYALRVSELVISPHFPGIHASGEALAAGIDAHCREVAGSRDLSWQYCVGAIVWFIGTDGIVTSKEKPR